jgi:hypothetical protein
MIAIPTARFALFAAALVAHGAAATGCQPKSAGPSPAAGVAGSSAATAESSGTAATPVASASANRPPLPPPETSCNSDANCDHVTVFLHGDQACCSGFQTFGTKAWAARVREACDARALDRARCPDLKPYALRQPACMKGHCDGR